MKHKRTNRTLGRKAHHRSQLFKQLTSDLLSNGSLVTTTAKAKELQRHIEPLITAAKGELTLARRRQLLAKLRAEADLERLTQVAQDHAKRPGGYTRLSALPNTRHDAAATARVDIIDFKAL